MERTQLSSNLIAEKIIIFLIILFGLFLYSVHIIPDFFFLFVSVLILCCSYMMFWVAKNISYNEASLFIKNGKTEKNIEFGKIVLIKVTPLHGSWRTMWKIIYLNNSKEETTYFYAKYGLISMDKFIKVVRLINPTADIKYYTTTLDVLN